MHMKDRVKDDSFLQRFVFGPYSAVDIIVSGLALVGMWTRGKSKHIWVSDQFF